MRLENLTQQKFGQLVVIERATNEGRNKKHTYWLCKCDCGNYRIVATAHLKSGHTKSCGCLALTKKDDKTTKMLKKIYQGMKNRCYNSNVNEYGYYGGRGIKVCNEWLESFTEFHKWAMSNGYADGLTIDRKDVNGNYEPNNCRWATMKEQSNNTRNNHKIEYNGETHTLTEWAELLCVHKNTLSNRILRGWTIERALTEKVHKKK